MLMVEKAIPAQLRMFSMGKLCSSRCLVLFVCVVYSDSTGHWPWALSDTAKEVMNKCTSKAGEAAKANGKPGSFADDFYARSNALQYFKKLCAKNEAFKEICKTLVNDHSAEPFSVMSTKQLNQQQISDMRAFAQQLKDIKIELDYLFDDCAAQTYVQKLQNRVKQRVTHPNGLKSQQKVAFIETETAFNSKLSFLNSIKGARLNAPSPPTPAPTAFPTIKFDAQLKKEFVIADKNHDQTVTKLEFRIFLANQGIALTDDEFNLQFKHLDTNGDGKVTPLEFYGEEPKVEKMVKKEAAKLDKSMGVTLKHVQKRTPTAAPTATPTKAKGCLSKHLPCDKGKGGRCIKTAEPYQGKYFMCLCRPGYDCTKGCSGNFHGHTCKKIVEKVDDTRAMPLTELAEMMGEKVGGGSQPSSLRARQKVHGKLPVPTPYPTARGTSEDLRKYGYGSLYEPMHPKWSRGTNSIPHKHESAEGLFKRLRSQAKTEKAAKPKNSPGH